MDKKQFLRQYLTEPKAMHIATVHKGKPWICTVYFVVDDEGSMYWLSQPNRRHSQELESYNHAAVAVAIQVNQPVIGVQAEGRVETVSDKNVVKSIMQTYIAKYGQGKDFYDNFTAGTNSHRLYKFIPSQIVLFDEEHFKGTVQTIK